MTTTVPARAPGGRHAAPTRAPRLLASAAGTVVLTAGLVAALSGATTPGYAVAGPATRVGVPPVPRTEDVGLAAVAQERAATAAEAQRAAEADRVSRDAARAALPAFVLPVDGPVTSPFGHRWGRLHAGLDFGVPVGTPVRSVADAVVVAVSYDAHGYGNYLTLQLGDGTTVVLGHLSQVLVPAGPVTAGQVVALSGDTGHSTGPHLHFELRTGEAPFDPRPWLAARGIVV